jgi:hypothetical protein
MKTKQGLTVKWRRLVQVQLHHRTAPKQKKLLPRLPTKMSASVHRRVLHPVTVGRSVVSIKEIDARLPE